MNPKLKTILIVLVILLVPAGSLIGGYLLYKNYKAKGSSANDDDASESNNNEDSGASSNTSTASSNSEGFPLKRNPSKKSDLVKQLQERLNDRIAGLTPPTVPYYNSKPITELAEDGYYGDKTVAVVKFLFPKTDGKEVSKEMFDSLSSSEKYLLFKF